MTDDGVVMRLDFTGETYGRSLVHSHRSTTSSRFPGRDIQGTVQFEAAAIVVCPDCGQRRMASPHPHSAHWKRSQLVDCIGRVLNQTQTKESHEQAGRHRPVEVEAAPS